VRKFLATACVALVATLAAPAVASAATDAATTKFCDANFRLSSLYNELDAEATPKQMKAFAKRVKPALNAAAQSAPAEIEAQVTTAVDALKADPTVIFTDTEIQTATGEIDSWAVENCGYQTVDVTGADYSFSGIPATLSTGKTVVTFQNTGAEFHEFLVVRKKNDKSVEELLALPQKQAEKQTEFVGAAFAAPGQTSNGFMDIKTPGNYVALCAIPVGTTDIESVPEDGAPHFTEGMVTEFTVS